MAPPPLPPDYTGPSGGMADSSGMGWVNPTPQTVSHVQHHATSPSATAAPADEWGGWGAPTVKAPGAENGGDPWDYQAGASDPSTTKVTGQNAASTNQVIGS